MPPLTFYFKPFLFTLLLWVLLECSIALTPLDRYLEDLTENPLAQKFWDLQAHEPKNLDILVLGTSRTHNGFSPHAFQQALGLPVTSYNMGLPASKYGPLTAYLMDHTQRYGKPKMVLLETTDFMLNPSFYSYNITLYYQTLVTHHLQFIPTLLNTPLLRLRDKKHLFLSSVSRVFRYRSVLSPFYLKKVAFNQHPKRPDIENGWEPRAVDKRMYTAEGIQNSADNEAKFALSDFKTLDTSELTYFLQYCQQAGIQVVFIEWPNHPAYLRRFEQAGLRHRYEAVRNKIAQTNQIALIDLNQQNPPENQREGLFANTRHLSKAGALFYSELLAKKLLDVPQAKALLTTTE